MIRSRTFETEFQVWSSQGGQRPVLQKTSWENQGLTLVHTHGVYWALVFLEIYYEQWYTDSNMCWNECAKNGDGILDQVLEVCVHSDCALVWVVAGSSAFVTDSSRVREEIQAHGFTTEPWLVLLYRPWCFTHSILVRLSDNWGLWSYDPLICGDYKCHCKDFYSSSNVREWHIQMLNSCDQTNRQTFRFSRRASSHGRACWPWLPRSFRLSMEWSSQKS